MVISRVSSLPANISVALILRDRMRDNVLSQRPHTAHPINIESGYWNPEIGIRNQKPESRIQNTEYRIQNPAVRIQNPESRIQNPESSGIRATSYCHVLR